MTVNGITDFVISCFKRTERTSTYYTHKMCQYQFILTLGKNISIGYRYTYQKRISSVDRATFLLMKICNALVLLDIFSG